MSNIMIETERLRLYPISDRDMREIIESETDEEMKQAYSEMLQGCLDYPEQRIWYAVWNIEAKEEGESVGDLCFKGLGEDGMVEVGYGTKGEFRNRGYMTEAVIAISKWAMSQEGVTKVEAETDPDNMASQRVLAKAGYEENGVMGEEGPRFVYIGETI